MSFVMPSRSKSTEFKELSGVLRKIQFMLETNPSAPMMVARQTAEEFAQQQLPAHCSIIHRTLQGPRVPVRKATKRQYSDTLAKWPNDGMKETLSFTWYIVVNGAADIRVWDYAVSCREGDVLFVPGRTPRLDGTRPHYEIVTPEAMSDILMIRMGQLQKNTLSLKLYHSHGAKCFRGAQGENCWLKHPTLCQTMSLLSDTLITSGHSKSTFHLFLGILLLIGQEINEGKCFSSWNFPSESYQLKRLTPIEQAKNYMQNHVDRPLSLKQVARWVGLSRTVFVRTFRQATGQTFHEYLTALRLQRAEAYLLESTLPINKISTFVGLTPNQLRNLFQKRHRCSPREFRTRQRTV